MRNLDIIPSACCCLFIIGAISKVLKVRLPEKETIFRIPTIHDNYMIKKLRFREHKVQGNGVLLVYAENGIAMNCAAPWELTQMAQLKYR